jgi:hypothetical protein
MTARAIGLLRIDYAKRHRRRAGSVRGDEAGAVAARLLIDQIIDVALAIDRDLLGLVAGDRRIAHQPEKRMQLFGLGMRVLDELEAVGAHRIVGADGGGRRVVRKRTHGESPKLIWINIDRNGAKWCKQPGLARWRTFVHESGIFA